MAVQLRLNILSPTLDQRCIRRSSGLGALDHGGFVSRAPFEPLSDRELDRLRATPPVPLPGAVTAVDLGQPLLEAARTTVVPLLDPERPTTIDGSGLLRSLQARILEELYERFGIEPLSVGAADLVAQPAGRASTAHNPRTGEAMGLHIDSHQRLPLHRRGSAMTLCAVNVGVASRYFHFVARPVAAIVDELLARGTAIPESAWDLKEAYLSACPEEPVYRLELAPGQAYLCTTQDTIHDGSTGPTHPDLAVLTMFAAADHPPHAEDR